MDKEPKSSFLPIAFVSGVHLVCCVALILFLSGTSGFAAWLGGSDTSLYVGTVVGIGVVIMLIRRMRKSSALTETKRAQASSLKGDQ